MKKFLFIIVIFFLIFGNYNSVIANNLNCRDDKDKKIINIFYDQNKIEAIGKTFTNVLIFGNGISAEYSKWKSSFLGFEKILEERWKINLEFSEPKSVSIIKFKYDDGISKKLSESFYLCK